MLGSSRTPRTAQHHAIKRLLYEPLVVDVCTRDLGSERNAAAIGQDVALDPALGSIRRVRAGVVPPLGAFTIALSSEPHFHWMPRRRS